jgi:F-type H+-transporting ATPase subunit gamma
MASLKEVRVRIQSVISTQQITKAMKMVAAAKLRRAQDRIVQLRPFEARLTGIIDNLTGTLPDGFELSLARPNQSKHVLIVAVTSDRGLCGGFNTNITRAVTALANGEYNSAYKAGELHLLCVGKKGCEFFGRRAYNVIERFRDLFQTLNFERVAEAADLAISGYENGTYGKVILVYNEFKNVATQIVRTEHLLPLQAAAIAVAPTTKSDKVAVAQERDYLFEPSGEAIIEKVIPQMLRTRFYKALLESNASEQGARMTAMEKATENAGDLLKELRLSYNRTRQAAITTEILEIVGGAEALSSGN